MGIPTLGLKTMRVHRQCQQEKPLADCKIGCLAVVKTLHRKPKRPFFLATHLRLGNRFQSRCRLFNVILIGTSRKDFSGFIGFPGHLWAIDLLDFAGYIARRLTIPTGASLRWPTLK